MACKVIKFPGGGGGVVCGPKRRGEHPALALFGRIITAVTMPKLKFGEPMIMVQLTMSQCGHVLDEPYGNGDPIPKVGERWVCATCQVKAMYDEIDAEKAAQANAAK